jgi:hypothetical protein
LTLQLLQQTVAERNKIRRVNGQVVVPGGGQVKVWAYAIAIDHRPLLAALRQQQSYLAIGHGRPHQGRDLAADGLRYATTGQTAASLHLKYAIASARLGDTDAASNAVLAAHEARANQQPDDLTALGGEYVISDATHHYLSGSALSEISATGSDAATEIERAVVLYAEGPHPGEQHWFGARALASIDLAVLRLRSGRWTQRPPRWTPRYR